MTPAEESAARAAAEREELRRARLPKWAREQLERLEQANHYLRGKLHQALSGQAGRADGPGVYLEVYDGRGRPMDVKVGGQYARVFLLLEDGSRVHVHALDRLYARAVPCVRVHVDRVVLLEPASANVIHVREADRDTPSRPPRRRAGT